MTTYDYAELEGLWIDAGGPSSVASVAAAIALAESGGNPLAAYPGTTVAPGQGSTTDATGLWQILGLPAGNFTAAQLTDPQANAQMAVAKYQQAGNSFRPWQTYTSGAYEAELQSGVTPTKGTPDPGTSKTPTTKTTKADQQSQSVLETSTGIVGDASSLLHGTAETLNFFWEFFEPGQGWRLAFGAGAAALAYFGLRQWGLVPSVGTAAKAV